MAVIYKWELTTASRQNLTVPEGTEFLSVANQQGSPCVWGRVPEGKAPAAFSHMEPGAMSDMKAEVRTILMYGTGHSFPDNIEQQFLGTVLLQNGDLVVHIYEVK